MIHNYIAGTNKLSSVADNVSSSGFVTDIEGTVSYTYDPIGNLQTETPSSGPSLTYDWNNYGKLRQVVKNTGDTISFAYAPDGNRVSKKVKTAAGATTTFYTRDAQGNILSNYNLRNDSLFLTEHDIYGSKRLGVDKPNRLMKIGERNACGFGIDSFLIGKRFYELTDHLGDVLVTVSDKKIGVDDNTDGLYDFYDAELASVNDYFPGGMEMPGRKNVLKNYNYSYGGHQKIDELDGIIDMGDRPLNTKTLRTPKPDRKADKYPDISPYSYGANNPIYYIDPNGEELIEITIKTQSSDIKGELKLTVDKQIAQKIKDLVQYAIDNEIKVHFNSSFRPSDKQEEVQKTGTTPAPVGSSRHEGGFGIDFNLYDKDDKMISGNSSVTKETEFIKKSKELGFRWGGEFSTPDKIHIDAWPADEKSKYGYDSWEAAYKENQKDYKENTYEKETYKYDKPAASKIVSDQPTTPSKKED